MSNIEDALDGIVARLQAWPALADYKADHFPDVPERYSFGAYGEELLVSFDGSTYAGAEAIAPRSQQRTVDFVVTIIARSLRGPTGVMQIIEDIRQALFGWAPTKTDASPLGFTPMVMTKDQFIGEDEGIWRYAIVFQATTTVVAKLDALTGPPIARTTVNTAAGSPGPSFEVTPTP